MHTKPIRILIFVLLLISIQCSWGAPSYKRVIEQNGLKITLIAKGTRALELDAAGAPHAIGCFYPKGLKYGMTLKMRVDSRSPLLIDQEGIKVLSLGTGLDSMPSREQLKAAAESIEISISPDKKHVAFLKHLPQKRCFTTGPDGKEEDIPCSGQEKEEWKILHLLADGPPFLSPYYPAKTNSSQELQTIPWDSIPSPDEIISKFLKDNEIHLSKEINRSIWAAINAQPYGSPLDNLLLEVWPERQGVDNSILDRAYSTSEKLKDWKVKAMEKAKTILATGPSYGKAAEFIIALDDPKMSCEELQALRDKWSNQFSLPKRCQKK